MPDLEDEGEGELVQGLRTLPELQNGEVPSLVHGGKFALPGKTVAAHRKGPAADVRFAVFQAAHNGEEDGVLAGPEGGVSLPDVLGSGGGFEGDQLAALGTDRGGEGGGGKREVHRGPPVISLEVRGCTWRLGRVLGAGGAGNSAYERGSNMESPNFLVTYSFKQTTWILMGASSLSR